VTGRTWARAGFVLLAVALVVLCAAGEVAGRLALTLANVVTVASLARQLHRGGYSERNGWAVVLAGFAILVVHNTGALLSTASGPSPEASAFGAVSLVLGYVVLLVGGMLATVPHARRDGGGMLDAAVIGFAAASLVWALVLQPAHHRLGSPPGETAYEMSLILLISAMSGAVVRAVAVAREARSAAFSLLVAISATNVADIAATLTADLTNGRAAWWVNILWVVAYLAFARAAADPSSAAIAGTDRQPSGLTPARLVFLGTALAVNPAVAGLQHLAGAPVDVTLLSVGSLLMVPMVVTRIGLLARWHADAVRRLHDLASLDELTGLPNRRALTAHLDAALDRTAHGISPGTVVLYLDLDDFKAVNDTHGHATGDRLLQAVAARVQGCLRSTDLVARFGGDEFVVVLEGAPGTVEAVVVPSIEQALATPVLIGAVVASGRASIGVAAIRAGERADTESLLHRADAEMYRTKRANRTSPAPPAGAASPTPPPGTPLAAVR